MSSLFDFVIRSFVYAAEGNESKLKEVLTLRSIPRHAPAVQPVPSSVHVAHAHRLAVLPAILVFHAVTCSLASGRFSAGPRFTRPQVAEGRLNLTST